MSSFIIYKNAGHYSAATAAGLLFYSVSRSEAERLLTDAGADPAILDSPVDGLTWRSTLTAAFASEIQSLSSAIESLPAEQAETAAALHGRIDSLAEHQGALEAELADERRRANIRAEIARLERQLEASLPAIMAELPGHSRAEAWLWLQNSPIGQRIEELRGTLHADAS